MHQYAAVLTVTRRGFEPLILGFQSESNILAYTAGTHSFRVAWRYTGKGFLGKFSQCSLLLMQLGNILMPRKEIRYLMDSKLKGFLILSQDIMDINVKLQNDNF